MTHTPTRRLLALLLAVATVFSLLSMSVSAADEQTGPELKLVSTATEPLKKGDSFTVEVQFPSDIEFSNFELNFDFDLTQFKLTAVNTSYTRIVDGEEFEVNYIKNSGAVINMDPVVDEDNGEKYGGRIVEYILDPAKGINVKADKGILFTFTFEVLKCNADPQSISVYNRLFKKSLTAETFGDITPVITPAQISISHTLTAVPAKDATCTENGNTAYWICSACDKWFLDETGTTEITDKGSVVTKATGHKYQEVVDEKYLRSPATCTSPAVYYKSCSVCGAVGTETFESGEKAAHNYVQQHDANQHWKECSVCGDKIEVENHSGGTATCTAKAVCTTCGAEYGELAAHKYQEVVDEKYLKSPATCTSPAIYYKSCSVCGAVGTETFESGEKAAHNYVQQHDTEKHWKECSACGDKIEVENHSGGTATCTAKAVCTTCGAEYGELAAHKYQEVVDEKYLKSPATCTSPAIYYKSCSVCHAMSEETFTYGTTIDHSYEMKHDAEKHWEECSVCHVKTNEAAHSGGTATCTAKAVCSVCYAEYGELAAHNYQETVDAKYLKSAATCTSPAVYYKSCSVCHAMSEETFTYGTTIDHSYELKHDAEKHWEECSICHAKTNEAIHSGGTATCTEKAVCSTCNAKYGELAAHNYQETVDARYLKSAATCTSPAIYYKSCSVCHTLSEETFTYGTTIDHSYEMKHDAEKHWQECSVCHTKANEAAHSGGTATCTAKAVCSTCGAEYGELAAHNYQETVDEKYLKSPATCTSPAIYYKSCSVCGTASEETFTSGTTIDHSYEIKHDAEKHWEECSVCHAKTNEAAHSGGTATCTAKAVCSVCNAEYGELAAHDYQETVDAQYLKSAATCTSPAVYYKSCSVCGAASEETFIYGTTIEHSYELKHDAEKHWEECSVCHAKTNEAVHSGGTATCIGKAVCSVCHTEYGALADHDAVHHDRIEPTCTTTGSIEYWQCSVCGKKFSDAACTTEVTDVTLAKLPHSAGTAWEKDTTYHWHLCVNCGSEVMDKAAHTYGDWVTVTEATETEAGLRKRTCSVCGYEQTEEISMLRFTVTVRNGSGSGEYKSGETVTITADRRSGYTFEKWTVNSGNVTLAKETDSTTTFTMPAENVTVTATYRYNGGSGSGSGSSSGIVIKDENGKVLGKADPDTGIVELPINPVPAASSSRQAEELEITIPKNTTVKVEIPVRNVTPGTVVVIVHADGTEEIVRTSVVTKNGVALELTGSATVKVYDNSKFFTDVPAANWASDAVAFASSRELFNGTGADTFSPNAPMTRQMLMTVLARLDGTDTSGNAYAKGMEWAIRNGVSNGSDPEGKITREQLATMLWRYAGSPSVSGRMTGFVDADQIGGYAEDAMLWATKAGIIGGKGNGQLDPKGYATRAEVAAMLMRYCNTLFTK